MSTFDIIIPNYSATPELVAKAEACIHSIIQHSEKYDYRIIWIDNGSPMQEDSLKLIELLKQSNRHLVIRNRINQGFIRATNTGLQMSTAPYVVLMNNDTEATPQWLGMLRAPMEMGDKRIGLVGPRTTSDKCWQGRWKETRGVHILPQGHMLAFFCVMIKRTVIEQVGPLDESFGVGLGDDDWYCRQAQKAGWQLALMQELVIPHHHRSTFHTMWTPEEVKGMQKTALQHFHDKCQSAI